MSGDSGALNAYFNNSMRLSEYMIDSAKENLDLIILKTKSNLFRILRIFLGNYLMGFLKNYSFKK